MGGGRGWGVLLPMWAIRNNYSDQRNHVHLKKVLYITGQQIVIGFRGEVITANYNG